MIAHNNNDGTFTVFDETQQISVFNGSAYISVPKQVFLGTRLDAETFVNIAAAAVAQAQTDLTQKTAVLAAITAA